MKGVGHCTLRPLAVAQPVVMWERPRLWWHSGTAWTPRSWPQGQTPGPSEVDPRKETAFHHVPCEGNTPAKLQSSVPKQLVFHSVSRASLPSPGPTGSGPHVTGGNKYLEKQFRQPGKPATSGACTGCWEMRWGRNIYSHVREFS